MPLAEPELVGIRYTKQKSPQIVPVVTSDEQAFQSIDTPVTISTHVDPEQAELLLALDSEEALLDSELDSELDSDDADSEDSLGSLELDKDRELEGELEEGELLELELDSELLDSLLILLLELELSRTITDHHRPYLSRMIGVNSSEIAAVPTLKTTNW